MARLEIISSGGGGGGGGIRKVSNQAARLALTPADGDFVIQLDTDELYYWDGATWVLWAEMLDHDQLEALDLAFQDHINDTTDAHDASAISVVPTGNLAADDVQEALQEHQGDIDTLTTDLANHINDTSDAHDASAISYSNLTSTLAATDVQDAVDELDARLVQAEADVIAAQTDIDDHIADPTGAHAATAISFSPTGNIAATTVQAAIAEVDSETDARLDALELIDHVPMTLGAFGSSPNANGLSVSGTDSQTLNMQPANSTNPGGVSTAAQAFGGDKSFAASVAIGQTAAPNAKLLLEVVGTTKASFPAPSMTTTQRDALSAPVAGSQIYNSTTGQLEIYNGTNWEPMNGYAVPAAVTVSNAGTMTLGKYKRQVARVSGNGGAADIVVAHTALLEGSEVVFMGTNDTNTVTLFTDSVLILNGTCTLGLNDTLTCLKVGSVLYEQGRSE